MKKLHTFLLTLFFVTPLFAQERAGGGTAISPASQSEVNTGVNGVDYVSPLTLAGNKTTNWIAAGGQGYLNFDAAVAAVQGTAAPILLGYGTYYFTNCVTNFISVYGQGSHATCLVAYTPNTNSANVCPAINWQANEVFSGFECEFQNEFGTNYQAFFGWNNANFAPVSAHVDNVVINDLLCTNAGSDFFYFQTGVAANATNDIIQNSKFFGQSDLFVDFSGSFLTMQLLSDTFLSQGPSTFPGFIGQGSGFRLNSGIPVTFTVQNCTFGTFQTNGYPLSISAGSSALSIYITGSVFTNSNPGGFASVTNLFLNVGSLSGQTAYLSGNVGLSSQNIFLKPGNNAIRLVNGVLAYAANVLTNQWPPTFTGLNAPSTNAMWMCPSNVIGHSNMWFGTWDANSNAIFSGHIP